MGEGARDDLGENGGDRIREDTFSTGALGCGDSRFHVADRLSTDGEILVLHANRFCTHRDAGPRRAPVSKSGFPGVAAATRPPLPTASPAVKGASCDARRVARNVRRVAGP